MMLSPYALRSYGSSWTWPKGRGMVGFGEGHRPGAAPLGAVSSCSLFPVIDGLCCPPTTGGSASTADPGVEGAPAGAGGRHLLPSLPSFSPSILLSALAASQRWLCTGQSRLRSSAAQQRIGSRGGTPRPRPADRERGRHHRGDVVTGLRPDHPTLETATVVFLGGGSHQFFFLACLSLPFVRQHVWFRVAAMLARDRSADTADTIVVAADSAPAQLSEGAASFLFLGRLQPPLYFPGHSFFRFTP
eukprot:COSAG01_NODE_4494_length_4977_cov_25.525010_3_plen_246_part_00